MNETFMKEKPVFPLLLSMGLPMMLSMLVNSLYNIVDSYFVAKISEDAMTALSLVYPLQNFINAVAIGFGVGINAQISYYLGAQQYEKADRAATLGTLLSAIHGLILMIVCIAVMPKFLALFTANQTVIDLGVRYSTIAFLFSVIIGLQLAFEKLFQAVGRMKVSMVALTVGSLTNIVLDPVMIFGLGPCPAMGIEGAAWATGIGQSVNLLIYLVIYKVRPMNVHLRRDCLKPDKAIITKLYGIGIPAILNLALPSLLISALNSILAVYSQSYVVALGIYYKLQTFLYLPANGIIQGMRPLIGYNYGAKERARVRRIYILTLAMGASIMAFGTVLCLALPKQLIAMFTSNPETLQIGTTALRTICAGFIVSAVSITSCGALEGLSKGKESLAISLSRYIIIILPVAFLFSRIFGPTGVWHAFWVAETVTAAVSFGLSKRKIFGGEMS